MCGTLWSRVSTSQPGLAVASLQLAASLWAPSFFSSISISHTWRSACPCAYNACSALLPSSWRHCPHSDEQRRVCCGRGGGGGGGRHGYTAGKLREIEDRMIGSHARTFCPPAAFFVEDSASEVIHSTDCGRWSLWKCAHAVIYTETGLSVHSATLYLKGQQTANVNVVIVSRATFVIYISQIAGSYRWKHFTISSFTEEAAAGT